MLDLEPELLAIRCLVLGSELLESLNESIEQMLIHSPVSRDRTIEALRVYLAASRDRVWDAVEGFPGQRPEEFGCVLAKLIL